MEKPNRISVLIIKYLYNKITTEEQQELDEWRSSSEKNRLLFERLTDQHYLSDRLEDFYQVDEEAEWQKIVQASPVHTKTATGWWKYAAAAAILLLTVAGVWMYLDNTGEKTAVQAFNPADGQTDEVLPGKDIAVLTLADGTKKLLNNTVNETLAQQGPFAVVNSNGTLSYRQTGEFRTASGLYNQVTTPRGGQYAIELPDGSKVWLNAASSIRFPAAFDTHERIVEVTGEAYFEIVSLSGLAPALPTDRRDKLSGRGEAGKIPFIVKIRTTAGEAGEIKVLGTKFNINAYDDEARITTTLLEGSVQVTGFRLPVSGNQEQATGNRQWSAILKPGQQAELNADGKINVAASDTTDAMGWRQGLFRFDSVSIQPVMRQLARWYDVEVEYKDGIVGITDPFVATIPRNTSLAEVLEILTAVGGMHFSMDGRKIIVSD